MGIQVVVQSNTLQRYSSQKISCSERHDKCFSSIGNSECPQVLALKSRIQNPMKLNHVYICTKTTLRTYNEDCIPFFPKFDHFGLRSIAVRRITTRARPFSNSVVQDVTKKRKNIGRAARKWIGIAHVFRESQKSEVFSTRISSKSLIVDRVNHHSIQPKGAICYNRKQTNHKLDYH